jgi:hypothetical protein
MRSALLHRPEPDRPALLDAPRAAARGPRLEICPPRTRRSPTWLAIVGDWLRAGWPGQAASPAAPRPDRVVRGATSLADVRREFIEAVDDIHGVATDALLDQIHFARSLHELWHLRAEVFSLVSLHHSQAEAAVRLDWLNRHFPTRSPRSGFGSLTSKDMWP